MSGLWRNQKDTPEGKYLVKRRDGTVPEWPYFVLGANDPAAATALWHYAKRAEELGMDSRYVFEVRGMALEWQNRAHPGRPDGEPDIKDDPETLEQMRLNHE